MRKSVQIVSVAAAALSAVVAAIHVLKDDSSAGEAPEKPASAARVPKPPKKAAAKQRPKAVAPVAAPVRKAASACGLYAHMTPEDGKLATAIQDALDAEDLGKLKDLLAEARKSKNAEIRRLMVEALQWFDTKAMLQLAGFLADEDEEVREAAVSAWEMVLGNVEDEQVKAGLIVESLQMVQNGDDADRIASEFHTVDQKLAIDSMIKLLYGTLTVSKAAREKILETYEFITGEEYTNAQAARQWLKENYTPPEKD